MAYMLHRCVQERSEAEHAEQAREAEDEAVSHRLSGADVRLLNWHWAHLEYGCSSRLHDVSLAHWNQVCSQCCFCMWASLLPWHVCK